MSDDIVSSICVHKKQKKELLYCPWNQNVLEKCYCCRLCFIKFKSHTLHFLFGCEFPFIKYLFDDKYCIFFWNWGIDRSVFDIRIAQKEYGCNLCLVMGTNFILAELLEGWRIIKEYQCNLLANCLDKCCKDMVVQ